MAQIVTLESVFEEIIELKLSLSKVFSASKNTLDFEETVSFINQSRSYLYKLTSQGLIPHYKPNGKKIYFKRSELEEWLLKNKVFSADELEEKVSNHLVSGSKR